MLLHMKSEGSEIKIQKMISILKTNASKCLVSNNKYICRNNSKSVFKGTGWCYRYVKIALFESGLTSKYIGGSSAIKAGKYLEEEGFLNILNKKLYCPRAPIGSILIYKTKRNIHGHIEVRTNYQEFVSDHVRNKIDGKIVGVYVKKQKGANNVLGNCLHSNNSSLYSCISNGY